MRPPVCTSVQMNTNLDSLYVFHVNFLIISIAIFSTVQHCMAFSSPNRTYTVTLAWLLGHRRRQKPPLIRDAPSHPSSPMTSQPLTAATIWGRTALSVSRPLSQSVNGGIEVSVDVSLTAHLFQIPFSRTVEQQGKPRRPFKRHSRIPRLFQHNSVLTFLIPTILEKALFQPRQLNGTLLWDELAVELCYAGTKVNLLSASPSSPSSIPSALPRSVSQISLLSLVWKEVKSTWGSFISRLDLSSFDIVIGFQWASRSLNPAQWRLPKHQMRKKKDSSFVLPGFELPDGGHTRIAVGVNLGIVSGVELKVRFQNHPDISWFHHPIS